MRFLIKNAMTYLPEGTVERRNVLVDGQHIAWVCTEEMGVPAVEIDLSGYTLLPGFINAHVHLMDCYDGFNDENLGQWLRAGVTHLRDEGILSYHDAADAVQWRARVAKACTMPTLSVCGRFVSAPGGYGGVSPLGVETAQEARTAVQTLVDAGVDHIKIAFDEGYDPYTRSLPMLAEAELEAVYQEANRLGVPVSAHALRAERVRTLLRTGVDEIAHACFDAMDDALLEAMVRQGVCMTPTLSIYGQMHAEYGAPMIHQAMDNTRRFVRLGGTIALGDDHIETHPVWAPVGMPVMEMELLRQAGLTMAEVVAAATAGGAAVMKRRDLGRVEAGCAADLIAVKGDPFLFPYLLSNVQFVMKHGVAVKQA